MRATLYRWFPEATPNAKLAILFLIALLGLLSVFCIWQEYRYARKARYVEALPYLNQIFLELNKFENVASVTKTEEIEYTFRRVVNRLAAALSVITGTMCSVCIKVILTDNHSDPPRPKVVTVVRDDTSLHRERGKAPVEEWIRDSDDSEVDHWIDQNTAYMQVFTQPRTPQACFFSNYLPGEKNYLNTSFHIYGGPPQSKRAIMRNLQWPLPYKSTIVSPIARAGQLRRDYIIAGYLAVDSRSRRVFNRRYDIDLVTGVADCLYSLLHHYTALIGTSFQGEDYDGDEDE
jgi:hypothetical protein